VDEEQRFDELYRRAGPRLWQTMLAYTGGRRDITDDVVAEAFARTLERAPHIGSFEPYLYRIAFRLAAGELRRDPTVATVPESGEHVDPELSELFDAMRSLSPGQRAAVFLRYQGDLPVAEVARLMGTTSAVVRVHLMRGRRRLAELLGDADD
jgi:RNA polymerase sigma-70 factor, ECF subfamily